MEILGERCLPSGGFVQANLASDIPGLASFTEPTLVNPWGISFSPGGPFWISNNGTGFSTLFDGTGQSPLPGAPLVVQVPPSGANLSGTGGTPTGTVFNGGSGFTVSENGKNGPSLFLFATEDGTISGWNPFVDPSHALLVVDQSLTGADYKGLATGSNASGTFLFAANFKAGTVDVFDSSFRRTGLSGSFADPNLPAGYAPYNVQNIGGQLFVSYALQDFSGQEDAVGSGHGIVDVFDTEGHLLRRLASGGSLNSPWGLAVAPAGFGAFGKDLLVGNTGDGRINVFDPNTGDFLGQLQDGAGKVITIPNLEALAFGGGGSAGDPNTLFFTAGPGGGHHGLFGSLQTVDPGGRGPGLKRSQGRTGHPGHPEVPHTDDSGNNYPLPPPGGPTLRGDVVGQPSPLPVLLPFKELTPPTALVTSGDGNGPLFTGSPMAIPARTGQETPRTQGFQTIRWSFGPPGTGPELDQNEVSRASYPQALDTLLELSILMDPTEGPAGDRHLPSAGISGFGPVGTVHSAMRETPLPLTTETTGVPAANGNHSGVLQPGNNVPVPAAHITDGIYSSPRGDEHQVAGRRFVDSWVALLVAFGVPLTWFGRHTFRQGQGKENRRPRTSRA